MKKRSIREVCEHLKEVGNAAYRTLDGVLKPLPSITRLRHYQQLKDFGVLFFDGPF